MSDVILANDVDGVVDNIITPLSKVLGAWRVMANSPYEKQRKQAIKKYPELLAELSRYQTSLEQVPYVDEELQEVVDNYILEIQEQKVIVARIQGRIENT